MLQNPQSTVTIYLAVWPNGTFSVVVAEDRNEAEDELDRLGAPSSARIIEYEGPLLIDYEWKLEEDREAEFPPGAEAWTEPDHLYNICELVLDAGFPHLSSYYDAVRKGEKPPSLDETKAALKLDQDTLSAASGDDPAEHI